MPCRINKEWLRSLSDEEVQRAYAVAVAADDYLQFGTADRVSVSVVRLRAEMEKRGLI